MIDVFIGGFAGSKRQARYTADALAEYYGQDRREVVSLSFAEAMDDRMRTHELVKGKGVLTHSAGTLSVEGAEFRELTSVAPPLPTPRMKLIARAGIKSFQMTRGALHDSGRFHRVMDLNNGQAGELLSHPYGNLRHLNAIAVHDCVEVASSGHRLGTRVRLGFMSEDAFGYTPSSEEVAGLNRQGIPAATIDGVHDEIIIYPQETIADLDYVLS